MPHFGQGTSSSFDFRSLSEPTFRVSGNALPQALQTDSSPITTAPHSGQVAAPGLPRDAPSTINSHSFLVTDMTLSAIAAESRHRRPVTPLFRRECSVSRLGSRTGCHKGQAVFST